MTTTETYDFTYAGHGFKREEITVVKCSPWIASIRAKGLGWTIPLSEVSPIFRAFLEKAGKKS